MTKATENRTTELQALSKLKKAGKFRYWRGVIEMPETELHAICDEIQAEHDQAVAATVGSDASAIRFAERLRSIADEMRNVGASSMTPHELLACYASDVDKVADLLTFAATLGSERDEIYNAGFDNGVKACLQILDGYLEYPHSAAENIQKWVDEQWEEYGA